MAAPTNQDMRTLVAALTTTDANIGTNVPADQVRNVYRAEYYQRTSGGGTTGLSGALNDVVLYERYGTSDRVVDVAILYNGNPVIKANENTPLFYFQGSSILRAGASNEVFTSATVVMVLGIRDEMR